MSVMQIPRKIEYALRAMIHLADMPDGVANGNQIAEHEHIPKYFLEKVIRDLMRSGLVRSRRGPGGGYQLSRPASTISFKDVIEAVEGPINLNVCLEDSSTCSLQPRCRMFRVWEHGQRVLLEVFAQTNLQEIASSKMPLEVLTAPSSVEESSAAMLKA
jgi:Rrf2 family protein